MWSLAGSLADGVLAEAFFIPPHPYKEVKGSLKEV